MRTAAIALGFLAFVASAIDAYGHGTPIHINVTSAKLAISNGVADPAGYAAMIFLDGSDDAQLEHTFVPGFGNVALTNLPGFEIQDMLPDSGLFLNVFPQTVKDSNPIQQRLLWHWDPSTERVAVAPERRVARNRVRVWTDQSAAVEFPCSPLAASLPPPAGRRPRLARPFSALLARRQPDRGNRRLRLLLAIDVTELHFLRSVPRDPQQRSRRGTALRGRTGD